jgi:ABC-type lipoprotein export system ATPase subunit
MQRGSCTRARATPYSHPLLVCSRMIRCTDVRMVYRRGDTEIAALDGVSLEILAGTLTAIMGPSGSGKSTLLHLIGGLDRPTHGELLVDGRLIAHMSDDQLTLFRRAKVGFVFQFFNLISSLTAVENVALPLVLGGTSKAAAEERADQLLARVGLEQRRKHLPAQLSGGEIQRIAIARALAYNPPIILADEPTGNLDSKTGESILELLRRINREQNCTIAIVTHSREAAQSADRVITLRDGRVDGG